MPYSQRNARRGIIIEQHRRILDIASCAQRRVTMPRSKQKGVFDELVVALLCFATGLTLLRTGLNDRASGQSVVRERDRPTRLAKSTGPTAGEFKRRVWMQLGGGAALLVGGAGILFFSLRSSLGRKDSPDDET